MVDPIGRADDITAARADESDLAHNASQAAAFDRAVQRAETKRTHADGLSPAQHGYEKAYRVKPGDNLDAISRHSGLSLSKVEAHNAQIRNPNLIHPGDVVFLPRKPTAQETQVDHAVSDARSASHRAAQLSTQAEHSHQAAAKVQDARSAASAKWRNVQDTIADQFRAIGGNGQAFPENAIAPRVNELNGQAAGDRNFKNAINGARNEVTAQWHAEGRTHKELDPLYKADGAVAKATQSDAKARAFNDLVGKAQSRLKGAEGSGSAAQQQSRIDGAASRLKALGPKDPTFGKAVDQAASNLKGDIARAAEKKNEAAPQNGTPPQSGQKTTPPNAQQAPQQPTPQTGKNQTPGAPATQGPVAQSPSPQQQNNPQHLPPFAFAPKIAKAGFGSEFSGKATNNPTGSIEPYGKISVALGSEFNINAKVKYTPRVRATASGIDKGYTLKPGEKPKFADRIKSLAPEKVTVDVGGVFGKKVEVGRSWEFNFKENKINRSVYCRGKEPGEYSRRQQAGQGRQTEPQSDQQRVCPRRKR